MLGSTGARSCGCCWLRGCSSSPWPHGAFLQWSGSSLIPIEASDARHGPQRVRPAAARGAPADALAHRRARWRAQDMVRGGVVNALRVDRRRRIRPRTRKESRHELQDDHGPPRRRTALRGTRRARRPPRRAFRRQARRHRADRRPGRHPHHEQRRSRPRRVGRTFRRSSLQEGGGDGCGTSLASRSSSSLAHTGRSRTSTSSRFYCVPGSVSVLGQRCLT